MIRGNDLPDIRFHDSGHSRAAMLPNPGFSMKTVQEQPGHTRYTTTANPLDHSQKYLKNCRILSAVQQYSAIVYGKGFMAGQSYREYLSEYVCFSSNM